MIKMVEPTHVAVLFDGEHENYNTTPCAEIYAILTCDYMDKTR